jgi:hypothetical protein
MRWRFAARLPARVLALLLALLGLAISSCKRAAPGSHAAGPPVVVSPAGHPQVHAREAEVFAPWLVGAEAQALIGSFGVDDRGGRLFVSDAPKEGPP